MKISVEKRIGVAVMGGGAAGMAAAVAAARALQGAGVDLRAGRDGDGGTGIVIFERNNRLGRKLLATGNGRCNFTNSGIAAADYRSRGYGAAAGRNAGVAAGRNVGVAAGRVVGTAAGRNAGAEAGSDFGTADAGRVVATAAAGRNAEAAANIAFVSKVLEGFGPREIRDFFESVGVFSRQEEAGRVYPFSGQAASLRDALEAELESLGVETLLEDPVAAVEKRPEGFAVALASGRIYLAELLIVATGGKAGLQYGSTGDGYGVAKGLGHRLAAPGPALVQMVVEEAEFAEAKGVRAPGRVSLLEKGRELAQATGEIQFTEKALSGICVFDLSGFMERQKSEAGEYQAEIDLFPELSVAKLSEKLRLRQEYLKNRPVDDFLDGILPKKLCPLYLRRWKVSKKGLVEDIAPEKLQELAELLKAWRVPLKGTKGWAEAQVTAGGVDLGQVNAKTLESKLTPGLYFAGELLDVDGPCGGWNLHWAWASGLRAGQAAARKLLY